MAEYKPEPFTENITDAFLLLYERCLTYGGLDSLLSQKLQAKGDTRTALQVYQGFIREGDYIRASHLFSRDENSKSREAFLYFVHRLKLLDKSSFTNLFYSVYCATDTNTSFFGFYSYDRIFLMSNETNAPFISFREDKEFQKLPAIMRVYRGIKTSPANIERCGFSWTLSKNIAAGFAVMAGNTGYIVEGDIEKINVWAYINTRGEREIIAPANVVRNKTITLVKR